MAKIKSKWICQNCGHETSGYLGRCPDCNEWGTIIEERIQKIDIKKPFLVNNAVQTNPQLLKHITLDDTIRFSTGIEEFDRVFGGGLVKGSLVLIGGEPGIGKSTIVLQSCGTLANQGHKVLYVSAEESARQIKLRASRLEIDSDSLYVYSETNIEEVQTRINDLNPEIVIIDSIQAIYSSAVTSSTGSISQVRECCNILMNIAKTTGITVIVVGHVTKDGMIAGPKVLEHMVDTVLYFEGERYKSYRLLRSIKNRFGSTNDIGVFNMENTGLVEVLNPSELFLTEDASQSLPEVLLLPQVKGQDHFWWKFRLWLVRLLNPSPRRVTTGLEYTEHSKFLLFWKDELGLI